MSAYEASPAQRTIDAARRRIIDHYTAGDKEMRLSIIGRSLGQVLRLSLLLGGGLGVVTFVIAVRFIGVWALPLAVALGLGGAVLVDLGLANEFRRWQDKMLDGLPVLAGFVPAFLEVGSITPREALALTLPFLPEPLRSEMSAVVDRIARTGGARHALDALAEKVRHPLFDAVCFRLAAAWDVKVTPDIFADLQAQMDERREKMATRATTAKTGLITLISVLGLVGAALVFGYPGFKYMVSVLGGGFGE
ncbi:MAG: hypothetical protein ACOYU7_10145 [Bacillota bacterium]